MGSLSAVRADSAIALTFTYPNFWCWSDKVFRLLYVNELLVRLHTHTKMLSIFLFNLRKRVYSFPQILNCLTSLKKKEEIIIKSFKSGTWTWFWFTCWNWSGKCSGWLDHSRGSITHGRLETYGVRRCQAAGSGVGPHMTTDRGERGHSFQLL